MLPWQKVWPCSPACARVGQDLRTTISFHIWRVVTQLEHFLSVSKRGLSDLHKETAGRCSPWRARCTGRGPPRSGIAGGSASQSEPGKEGIQNWENAKWLSGPWRRWWRPRSSCQPSASLGRTTPRWSWCSPGPRWEHFVQEKIKKIGKGMRLQPGWNVSEGEADVKVRVPERKAVAEKQALFIVGSIIWSPVRKYLNTTTNRMTNVLYTLMIQTMWALPLAKTSWCICRQGNGIKMAKEARSKSKYTCSGRPWCSPCHAALALGAASHTPRSCKGIYQTKKYLRRRKNWKLKKLKLPRGEK